MNGTRSRRLPLAERVIERFSLPMTTKMLRALQDLAAAKGVPMSEVARRLIKEGLERETVKSTGETG